MDCTTSLENHARRRTRPAAGPATHKTQEPLAALPPEQPLPPHSPEGRSTLTPADDPAAATLMVTPAQYSRHVHVCYQLLSPQYTSLSFQQ